MIAKVQPVNSIGPGDNAESSGGALVEVVPHKPSSPPARVYESASKTAIGVSYGPLTGVSTGGSTILSYELQWNQGTGSWQSLVGYNPFSTATTYVTPSTLTTGQQYQFKYRAANAQGWGPFSDAVTLVAAGKPAQLSPISTSLSGSSVVASWSVSDTGGLPVTGFTLQFETSQAGTFATYSSSCGGSALATSCTIPMSTFTSSPYSLTQGTLIVGVIQATSSIGTSDASAVNTQGVVVQVPPASPASVTVIASGTDQTQITLEMPEVTGTANGGSPITAYSLEWDVGSGNGTFYVVQGSSDLLVRQYVLTGLIEGLEYKFRHRVQNVFGWSNYSPQVLGIAAVSPNSPSAPTTTNVGTSVRVDWTAPYNGGDRITRYLVEIKASDGSYQSSTSSCLESEATMVTSHSCEIPMSALVTSPLSLTEGTIVIARITAENRIGLSSSGTANTDGAIVKGVPHAPSTGPIRGGDTTTTQIQILLNSLTGSEAGYATITSYHAEWDEGRGDGTFSEIAGGTTDSLATSFTLTSPITASSSYTFRYRAKNVFGFGVFSPETVIKAIDAPDQPSPVTVANVAAVVEVSWTAPATNGSPITGYEVAIQSGTGSFTSLSACVESSADVILNSKCTVLMSTLTSSPFGLTEGQSVSAKVRAQNEQGYGAFGVASGSAVIYVVPHTPTSGPTRVDSSTGPTQLTVEMPEISSASSGGSSILSYSLEWDSGAGAAYADLVGLSSDNLIRTFTQTSGVTEGSSYSFRYRVKNIMGWSNYSPSVDIVAASAPSAPLNVVVTSQGTDVVVSWTPPTSVNGDSITAYKILIQTSVSNVYAEDTTHCSGSASSIILSAQCTIPMSVFWSSPFSLARGTSITAKVLAANDYGFSEASLPNTSGEIVKTKPARPGTPARVSASTDASRISVSWSLQTTDDQTGGSSITAYSLEWDSGTSGLTYSQIYSGSGSSYTHSSQVVTGTSYLVRLKTTNIYGDSQYSPVLSILAATNPSTPGTVVTTQVSAKVRLSWTASSANGSGLTSYSIYIKTGNGGTTYLQEQTYCDGVALAPLASPY